MAVILSKDKTEMIITCNCGCDETARIKVNLEDEEYYALMCYMNGNFYKDQEGVLYKLKWKLKKIWAIIANKDHYYSDIVMNKEEYQEFKKYINQF